MHTRCVAAAASGFKRRGPVEGSEREGVGKRKRKEKKRKEKEREKKKGKGGGGRKSYEASTAQDCEFSTLSEQKPKKKFFAPALTRRGARDFGFAKARVNQSNGQVTFSGVLPP
jgi:hypothetical protein